MNSLFSVALVTIWLLVVLVHVRIRVYSWTACTPPATRTTHGFGSHTDTTFTPHAAPAPHTPPRCLQVHTRVGCLHTQFWVYTFVTIGSIYHRYLYTFGFCAFYAGSFLHTFTPVDCYWVLVAILVSRITHSTRIWTWLPHVTDVTFTFVTLHVRLHSLLDSLGVIWFGLLFIIYFVYCC